MKELIEKLEDIKNYNEYWYNDKQCAIIPYGVIDEAIQALQQNNWIKVEDRLPEYGQQVLVYGVHRSELYDYDKDKTIGKVQFERIDYSRCIDTCYYEQYYSDITHWMPLPKPPIE